jgi:hypothetical protein
MKPLVLLSTFLMCFMAAATVPPAPGPRIEDLRLIGDLSQERARFVLTATVHVDDSREATLTLLTGPVALTDLRQEKKWRIEAKAGRFIAAFDAVGTYSIRLEFEAKVEVADGWKEVEFGTVSSSPQPIILRGLPGDTKLVFTGAARPELHDTEFTSFLPGNGSVKFRWQQAHTESEGKLFFAAGMLSQVSVSPGLLRQSAVMDFKVMQGELKSVSFLLVGPGEVTRVQGEHLLSWNIERVAGSDERRLVVQLNQAQRDQFSLQIQSQTPLGAFPQTVEVLALRPIAATRFAGYYRVTNEGAVRLEIAQSSGLSQLSPDQFPQTDGTKAIFQPGGSQQFVYRFSGENFHLTIQADQILPEITASQLIVYHVGENEAAIETEIELEIREAPLRELVLRVPAGHSLSRLTTPGLSDYYMVNPENQKDPELHVLFGQPVTGRQLLQLRLERTKTANEASWDLPRIDIPRAKSIRGHIATAADAGFRLTPERTSGLTEIATAFFPRKVVGIQSAFRLSDPAWQASLRIERLAQAVQADVLHLFSISEGIAYGSSVINYGVSGAPIAGFKIELSDEYFNVEFTGKDIRNWQKVPGGYQVQLHTPVSGAYTLLATYERPFKAQGDTLTFTGARPLDARSEQGHTLVISAYQFQVKPVDVSAGLLAVEPGELPAEYRLFFDAPVLAAYRYTTRPFNLKLQLSPLAQADSLSLVVDRASLTTKVSKEGQVLTDVRYFVKNRGNPHLKVGLPEGTSLWAAVVNGKSVVPVKEGQANLIPMPSGVSPNMVVTVDLKLASAVINRERIQVAAPIVQAPVMLAEWKLEPDTGQQLVYEGGTLTPSGGEWDNSGFAQVARCLDRANLGRFALTFLLPLALVVVSMRALHWGATASNKFNARHVTGLFLGLAALVVAAVLLSAFCDLLIQEQNHTTGQLSFVAPVQQAGNSTTISLLNIREGYMVWGSLSSVWPILLLVLGAITCWVRAKGSWRRLAILATGVLLAWAALRIENGGLLFVGVLGVFMLFQGIIPTLAQWWTQPPEKTLLVGAKATSSVATILILTSVLLGVTSGCASARPSHSLGTGSPGMADLVTQEIQVENGFVSAVANIRWEAKKNQVLPLLFAPAVLTHIDYPADAIRLEQVTPNSMVGIAQTNLSLVQRLIANKDGVFDLKVRYQVAVTQRDRLPGFYSLVQPGVVNRLKLGIINAEVDVISPDAITVRSETVGSNTVATATLAPRPGAWISWKPRSRDVKREQTVFYADLTQLYVPTAGVIEGQHLVSIRVAQGQLSELMFEIPPGLTITDVVELPGDNVEAKNEIKPGVSELCVWRFDPSKQSLRVTLSRPRSGPFAVLVKSQAACGPLPIEQSLGFLTVLGAVEQLGMVGLATGNEVQLDSVMPAAVSAINLEDFPTNIIASLQGQVAGLTLRRAFRYSNTGGTLTVKASSVKPDARVESQDTVSLGEDRTVLAANAAVNITRAGIFRISFVLPPTFDVESISGPALSHWTEATLETNRVITLHLSEKKEGLQYFAISLAGPGVRATNGWTAPQLVFREANKQTGTLLLVPEQGLRLQVSSAEGLTQTDPQKAGIKERGVLAFRVLEPKRRLTMDLERVDPWVQVTSLQHVSVDEAQLKVAVNLQYQIENTGIKNLHLFIPTNAENVQVKGDQVSDYLPLAGAITNGLQSWEIRLHRRVIGSFLLQLKYQVPMQQNATAANLRGIQVAQVNVQRGFVTIQSTGRLQVRIDSAPAALQSAEWQSIPRPLQQGLPETAANFSFRLVQPDFDLRLQVERYQAAQLLPGRVNSITLKSVISDDGVILTQASLEMVPGEKRLLRLRLPQSAHFWFAFVNQAGVWPWRERDQILIPLEQQALPNKPVPVEIFYTCKLGDATRRSLSLQLVAPEFDLPLENITWRVALSEKWQLKTSSGTLQLAHQEVIPGTLGLDLEQYLQTETMQRQQRTKQAEDFLSVANSALAQGDPQQARRAMQTAYGLSTHDAAFNEDARVQLHNIKLQEALVGLNVRQASAGGETVGQNAKLRELRDSRVASYSQQDAKDIIERNSSDENAAFMRLAERLIQQEDAAITTPAALHANIPEQGRLLTFKRAILVEPWAKLNISVTATATEGASAVARMLTLGGFTLIIILIGWAAGRRFGTSPTVR